MTPVLSIIIPVYNVEKYIGRCLDSIFQQKININTYEVIVVNDGTPDNSMKIVEQYTENYSNLKIIHQKNQGLSGARNTGLNAARGTYVWFIDSDDWLKTGSLAYVSDYLHKDHTVIATNLDYCYDDESKNKLERTMYTDALVTNKEYFLKYSIGAVQRYIINRSFLIKNQLSFLSGIYHEDADFGTKMVYYAKYIFVLKQPVYNYYQRTEGSIMSNWKPKNTLDYIFVYRELSLFLKMKVGRVDYSFFCWAIFNILLQAFPYKQYKNNASIRGLYYEHTKFIRSQALKSLKYCYASPKHFAALSICIVSPIFYNRLKENKADVQ